MTATRRNVLWPLIVIGVGSIWLLMVAGAFPSAVGDILQRAWPALLILFGLDVLVGSRRVFVAGRGIMLNYLGFVVVLAVVLGVVWFAYREQSDKLRTDTVASLSEVVPGDVERMQVAIDLERTRVSIIPAPDARQITAEFAGSRESEVDLAWNVQGPIGVLTVTETYHNAIPKLKDIGRGTLTITLPVDLVVEQITLRNGEGNAGLDLRTVPVERLDVEIGQGHLTLNVPDQTALLGDLRVNGGNLNLNVPVAVALTLNRGEGSGSPRYSYDADRYDLLADGELKRQNTPEFNVGLTVWLDSGASLIVTDVE